MKTSHRFEMFGIDMGEACRQGSPFTFAVDLLWRTARVAEEASRQSAFSVRLEGLLVTMSRRKMTRMERVDFLMGRVAVLLADLDAQPKALPRTDEMRTMSNYLRVVRTHVGNAKRSIEHAHSVQSRTAISANMLSASDSLVQATNKIIDMDYALLRLEREKEESARQKAHRQSLRNIQLKGSVLEASQK